MIGQRLRQAAELSLTAAHAQHRDRLLAAFDLYPVDRALARPILPGDDGACMREPPQLLLKPARAGGDAVYVDKLRRTLLFQQGLRPTIANTLHPEVRTVADTLDLDQV